MEAIVYLKLPFAVTSNADLETALMAIARNGFTTDHDRSKAELKIYVSEAGISGVSVFDAITNAKLRHRDL